ncbi:hypothetical protein [Rhizobium chutanense]|uniref:hypothetical protein n=1 Tax=Rhizobium chutanense TaxID=2035448 RepID=UPI0015CF4047
MRFRFRQVAATAAGMTYFLQRRRARSPSTASRSGPIPINTQPSGSGTFDDNPACGPLKAPEATDRSPSPSGNGGGPTGINNPAGTEKVQ